MVPALAPRIRRQGRWLARHGFLPGSHAVNGQIAPGELRLPCRSKAGKAGGAGIR